MWSGLARDPVIPGPTARTCPLVRTIFTGAGEVGSGCLGAVGLVLAAIIPFLLSVEGRPLQDYAAPVPGLFPDIGIRLVAVLPFIAIPAFMAVVARSTGLAFLLTILFFVADLAVTGTPFWPTSPVPWVPAVTVSGSLTRLLGETGTSLAAIAPSWVSVVALLGWAIVPAALAVARFRRLDLNE